MVGAPQLSETCLGPKDVRDVNQPLIWPSHCDTMGFVSVMPLLMCCATRDFAVPITLAQPSAVYHSCGMVGVPLLVRYISPYSHYLVATSLLHTNS
jgi:hypothetical protein